MCRQSNVAADSIGIYPDGGTNNATLLTRFYGGTLAACQDPNYGYNNGTVTRPAGLPAGACGWTNGIGYYGDDQNTHYNALQASLTKTFTRGLSFTTNYAWQSATNYASSFSTWDRRSVYGNDDFIRRQQLIFFGVYELPFGHGRPFLANSSGLMNQIVGGWQLSPILTWSSGLPFTLSYSGCSSVIPSDAPCYPNGKASTLKTNLGGYDPVNHRRLFYTGASVPLTQAAFSGFTAPGLNQIGTVGRNTAFGPTFFNTDLALQKNFPIWETVVGQFRMDAFNVFNHINPGNPGGAIDSGPQYITGQAGGAAARLLQFSLRVNF